MKKQHRWVKPIFTLLILLIGGTANAQSHELRGGELIIHSRDKSGNAVQTYQNQNRKTLAAGSVLTGKTIHAMEFHGSYGQEVMAKITQDFVENGQVIVPKGSKIMGYVKDLNDRRVEIRFDTIVFPSNHEQSISGYVIGHDQIQGVEGKLITKAKRRGRKVLGRSGGFGLRRAIERNVSGETLGGEVLRDASRESEGQIHAETNTRNQSTYIIRVKAGQSFRVVIDQGF